MRDYARIEKHLTDALQLSRRPVAIAFRDAAPAGVAALTGTQPSSCSFWRLAASGRTFYTVPSDHYNCPVGSYIHNIPLPKEREAELSTTLSMMVNVGYIRMEEVAGLPRLPSTPAFSIYAPLGVTPVDPDAVIIAGKPARLMLLQEAGTRAAKQALPLLGRPTCMAIPAALSHGVVSSLGCIGSRTYTSLSDDEFYTVIAGRDLDAVIAQLDTISTANAELTIYHTARRTMASA